MKDEPDTSDDLVEWFHASGETLCVCGECYASHHQHAEIPWLTVLCSGVFVKL